MSDDDGPRHEQEIKMKPKTLALVVTVLGFGMFAAATFQDKFSGAAPAKAALVSAGNPVSVGDRVTVLPEDARSWYCDVYVHEGWRGIPAESTFVGWFDADPRLRAFKQQMHHHLYTPNHPIYKHRYVGETPPSEFPACTIKRPDGLVIFKCNAADMPRSSGELVEWINTKINERSVGAWCGPFCRRRNQNQAPPQPYAVPVTQPPTQDNAPPTNMGIPVTQQLPDPDDDNTMLFLGIAVAAGGLVGLAFYMNKGSS